MNDLDWAYRTGMLFLACFLIGLAILMFVMRFFVED